MQGTASVPATVNLRIGGSSAGRRRKTARKSTSKKTNYASRAKLREAYLRGKYPTSKWAHPYVERGKGHFGISAGLKYSEVNPAEQAFRKSIGWRGRGDYTSGRGAYFGRVAGGFLGKAAATALSTTAAFSSGGVLSAATPFLHAGLSDIGSRAGSYAEDYVIDKYRTLVVFSMH